MKILLVGEYSRLHNSLKEGLQILGHSVTLISTGDYFKDYPADIKLKRKFYTGIGRKILVGMYRLFGVHIASISILRQFFSYSEQLKGYDVVQLINESPFGIEPKDEKKVISFLKKYNQKLFLLSCGTDFKSVSYALSDALPYSLLKAYKDGLVPASHFDFALKYVSQPFKELHEFLYTQIDGVIASDVDYHLPLKGHPKYLGLIPNPVVLDSLEYKEVPINGEIEVFLGINRSNYHTKGIAYFEKALAIIQQKYPGRINLTLAENIPYAEYIESYNKAHIVLDQVLSYDQGYNALEAMAKGKVVFTGAERVFMDFYKLQDPVAINALPDAALIAHELEKLLLQPNRITQIGRKARAFVEKHHDARTIANSFITTWQKA